MFRWSRISFARQRHRVARVDRSVGPDVDRELVVVGRLAEARRLDEVVHLLDRRVDRVDRDPADAEILVEVLVGRDVAAAALHAHLHVELAALGDGRDVRVRLEDLDVAVGLNVARAHLARLVDAQRQRLGVVDVQLERNLLQVEDDVGRVLDHAGESARTRAARRRSSPR